MTDLVEAEQRHPSVERGVLLALGRDRSGQLLEPSHERRLVVAVELPEEQLAQEVEQIGVEVRSVLERAVDGTVHELAIGIRWFDAGSHIAAVRRCVHAHLGHDVTQLVPGEVAPAAVAFAHSHEHGHHSLEVGVERIAQRLAASGHARVCIARFIARDSRVALNEALDPGRVDEHACDHREEVVAGRAVDGPAVGCRFGRAKDLLDGDPRVGGDRPQPREVALRVAQSVDVVHAQPVDLAVAHEFSRQSMGVVEDRRAFGAERDERVDVEEAAVVEFVGRRLPTGEAMMLALENRVEPIDVLVDLVEHDARPRSLGARPPPTARRRCPATAVRRARR